MYKIKCLGCSKFFMSNNKNAKYCSRDCYKKNKVVWNKGKHNIYSEETLRKMSDKKRGKSLSEVHRGKIKETMQKYKGDNNSAKKEEVRKKISEKLKGRVISEETRKKISEKAKQKIGKLNNFYGKKHTKESLRLMSESHKGQKVWNKGKYNIYSKETLQKMSESLKGREVWNKGLTKETDIRVKKLSNNLKYSITGRKMDGRKPSKNEYIIKQFLEDNNYKFEFNKSINCGVPDIYLPELNKAIEVNGCYYHVCDKCFPTLRENLHKFKAPEQTLKYYTKKLECYKKNSITVCEIWEHEFDKGNITNDIKKKIVRFLEDGN